MKFSKLTAVFIGVLILINFGYTKKDSISFDELLKLAQEFKKENKVILNFEKIDIKLLTYFMSALTGKNIVLNQNIKGEVSLIFNKPITIKQAWDIYTSILKSRNYSIIEKDGFIEVVPENLSRKTTPPVVSDITPSEELATIVYKVKNVDVMSIGNILRGIKSPRGMVFSYNPANTLIITDTKSNIKTLKEIVSFVESFSSEGEVKVFFLSYANSADVASALNMLFSDRTKKGIFFKVFNIRSKNAVIVKAPKEDFKDIESIISQVDKPTKSSSFGRTFHTIKLQNSKAEDLANILNKLLQNINLISVAENTKQQNQNTAVNKKRPVQPKPIINNYSQNNKDKPKIIAEKSTNTLIIYASKEEFDALRQLINSLDKAKKQVLITALITEVSEKALRELGVRWQIFGSSGGASFKGGISNEGFYNLIGSTNFAIGALSSSGKNITLAGTTLFFPDLLFLLSALDRGTGFNIISSPKLLTMDNEEGVINVAQVTPFAQSLKFDVNGNPIINYDYKEVGLKLKVVPHISGNNIRMELHQEINEVIGFEKPQIGTISYVVPITSKREINTSVTVENGKTIILGGLVSKKTIDTMEGVPLLSKIPILGNLFKYKSNELNKTNLFVFITPFIINSPEDIAKITEEHKKLLNKLKKLEEENKQENKVKPKKQNNKTKTAVENYQKYFGR